MLLPERMNTYLSVEVPVANKNGGCKQCGSCGCSNRLRRDRTSTNFSDPELAAKLEAALAFAWPPEKVPVSIEVFANQASGVYAVKVSKEGTTSQGIVAIDRSQSWYPDRVVALILEGARCAIDRLYSGAKSIADCESSL